MDVGRLVIGSQGFVMIKFKLTSWAAVAALGALTLMAGSAQAGTASWRVVKTLGPNRHNSRMVAVAATGPKDAWAAGLFCEDCTHPQLGVQHFNGHAWHAQTLPSTIAADDYGVLSLSASSAHDVLMVTSTTPNTSVAVRYNGSHWTASVLPSWVVRLAGSGLDDNVAATFGPKNQWDFSLGALTLSNVAARYNGHTWRRAVLPYGPLNVSVVSANDIWAVGIKNMALPLTKEPTYLMHWNGRSWSSVRIPMPHAAIFAHFISGLVGMGPKDAWIGLPTGGSVSDLTGELLHWNGSRWSHVPVPSGVFNVPTGAPVVQDGHGGLWMQQDLGLLYLYHYSGGHWTKQKMPGGRYMNLLGFSWVPGTSSVWAVGLDTAFPANTVKALIVGYGV
jgi:hypothetical protein